MTCLVSLALYLLLAVLDNFDITLDLRSCAISNFPPTARSKYKGPLTIYDIILHISGAERVKVLHVRVYHWFMKYSLKIY